MEKSEKKSLAVYLAAAFGVAWAMQAGVWALGSDPAAQLLMMAVMLVPTLAVLIAKGGLGRKAGICWRPNLKKSWPFYLLAWWVPGALTLLGAGLYFLVFPDKFGMTYAYLTAGYQAAGMEVENGVVQGMSLGTLTAVQIISALTFAPPVNMLLALGEEIGWRGYMTPRLQTLLGDIPGLLASGAIWGLWHAPLIALIGYEYGTGYFGAPVSGILLFCVFGAVAGPLLTLLYERTGSIWAPALAHGAINAAAALGFLFCAEVPTEYFLGPAACGAVSMLPALALAAALLLRRGKGA